MNRQELRKALIGHHFPGMKRGGAIIAAAMTPQARSLRSKKAAATRWAGHVSAKDKRMMAMSQKAGEIVAQRAKDYEPEITKSVMSAVEASGGKLIGLEYRLKATDSMVRKIYTKAKERGLTISDSANKIGDSVRFTSLIGEPPPGNYTNHVKSVMKALKDSGIEILEVETHWRRGDAYNGIHVAARHPSGVKFELQFHTPESIEAKNKNHPIYEIARLIDTSPAERARLGRIMVKNADLAPVPKGSLYVGTRVFRPVGA